MAVMLNLPVATPAALLVTYGAGAVLRIERGTLQAGPYTEIDTMALLAGTTTYIYWDSTGTTTAWYRVRYSDSGGTSFSAYDAAFQLGEAGLCDLEDVKRRLAIPDTGDDPWLLSAIASVTDEIQSVTGRSFLPDPPSGTKTVYLDYFGDGMTLFLPRGIRSVTYLGVAAIDQPDSTGTYTEVTTGYYLDPPDLRRSPGWPATRLSLGWVSGFRLYRGRRTIKLTGAFGWATVPPVIRDIAEMLVVSRYRARGSGGTSSFTIGVEGERTYQRVLTTDKIPALAAYTDVMVG